MPGSRSWQASEDPDANRLPGSELKQESANAPGNTCSLTNATFFRVHGVVHSEAALSLMATDPPQTELLAAWPCRTFASEAGDGN